MAPPKPAPRAATGGSKKIGSARKTTTVLEKIVIAIRALKDTSGKGSSRSSILKYLKAEFDYDNTTALKKGFQQGVSKNIFIQNGQSFRVAADPVLTNPEDNDINQLVTEDIEVGQGEPAAAAAMHGDTVTVAYKGTLDNGYEFDKANEFTFLLGAGDVIKGWDQGVRGMRKGGKRKLVVPPHLGYGKRGCAPDIPGSATLHFVVTLKDIQRG